MKKPKKMTAKKPKKIGTLKKRKGKK